MLYHLIAPADWAKACAAGQLDIPNPAEGFLHCAYRHQVDGVLQAWFPGRRELLALVIDPARLAAPVLDEDLYAAGERFPHIYGPVPLSAVVDVIVLRPGPEGGLSLPPES